MTIFRLAVATMFPAWIAVLFYFLEKKTKFSQVSYQVKQILIGIVFGGIAILATEFGISVDGAILNVRTAAPITAGLLFGGPAGIIAGIIGGVERWFSVYWSGGEYTRLACTIATVMSGFFASTMRKYMFDDKKVSWSAGFFIGLTMEVLHMLLVFVTNMSNIHTAFEVVEKCAPLMISLNSVAVALSLAVITILEKGKKENCQKRKQIPQIFRSGLMSCVVIALCVTCVFTIILQTQISKESTESTLKMGIQETKQSLREITENTFLIYTEWIAGDIEIEERPDSLFFEKLAKNYVVPEIFVVNAEGVIVSSNLDSAIGTSVPEKNRISSENGRMIWDYDISFLDANCEMQYAAVMLLDGNFVLVGYDKSFVVDEIVKRIETIATSKYIGQKGFLIISDEEGNIVSTRGEKEEKTLVSAGVNLKEIPENKLINATIGGTKLCLMYQKYSNPAGEYTIIAVLPKSEAMFARNTSVYIMAFMEILVFAALFILVYFLTKRVVVDNIHKVNDSLAKITSGNLNEEVDVRENEEFALLSDDINSTVSTLKHYISEAAERIDKELEFARAIQHSALPSVFPPYPNRKEFDIYALMDTAKEVGGDFYDFYLLDNDRLGLLIADVSGKGIPAAMFMMTAKSVIKGLAESGLEVNDIFTQANATLCEGNDTGMFVTAWIGILNLRTGVLNFSNAGHNPPLVRHKNGEFEFLRTHPNFILAGMKKTKYKKQELLLSPGDELFLYTDGVTEAKNTKKQMFREERLLETLNCNPDEGVENRCKNLLKKISLFVGEAEQFDDITMLTMKLNHLQTFDRIIVYPDLASTDAVWEFIDSKIKRAKLPQKISTKLKICNDEIYSNILRYSQATKAEIICQIEDKLLKLVFRDNGIPYDPTEEKEPNVMVSPKERKVGGLGIFMVKKSVKSMSYEYIDYQNVLTLVFEILN